MTTEKQPVELTQIEAAAEAGVPGPTHRNWRNRGLFGHSVQVGKGAHTSYPLDAVFRGNLLGAMNGWPLTDEEKIQVARLAEVGRAARRPLKGTITKRWVAGEQVSTFDPDAPSGPPPRFVMVRPGAKPLPQSAEGLADRFQSVGWPAFLVIDADLLFARALKAIEKKALEAK